MPFSFFSMRSVVVLLGVTACALALAGPAPETPVQPEDYQRLERLREREADRFQAQQAECYTRFAVNGCLKDEQSRHRAALAALQRQETALHERERAQRGAQQLARIQQKKLENQNKLEQATQAGSSAAEKMQEQHDRQAAHVAKAATSNSSAPRPGRSHSQLNPALQAQNRAAYERKLQQAETRRKEAVKRQAEKKPAAALPLSN